MSNVIDRALEMAHNGQYDGEHHVRWALDQMVRILTDCPTVRKIGAPGTSHEYEYEALGESQMYRDFITEYEDGEDGPKTYTWDEGIAP